MTTPRPRIASRLALPAVPARRRALEYAGAVVACLLVTGITRPMLATIDPTNVVMLYLLAVFMVAWLLGRGPALLAAFLAVALFDF